MNKKQVSLSIVLLSLVSIQQATLVPVGSAAVAAANRTLFRAGIFSSLFAFNVATWNLKKLSSDTAQPAAQEIAQSVATQPVVEVTQEAKASSLGALKAVATAYATSALDKTKNGFNSALNASKNGVNAGVELVKANPKTSAAAGVAVLALGYGCYKYGVIGKVYNTMTGLFKKSEVTEVTEEEEENDTDTNDAAAQIPAPTRVQQAPALLLECVKGKHYFIDSGKIKFTNGFSASQFTQEAINKLKHNHPGCF